jgi:uncharacterized protein with HEPN domain
MRDYKLYLDDILEATKRIQKYTKGLTLAKLKKNPLVLDAAARNLEIIGEAVKNIPPAIKTKHPEIEWKKIAGLRDILAHEYFGIDIEVIWDIVENKLPDFRVHIGRLARQR